ncbi:TylF/MycF family methyltransferase [Rhodospirillales bacterium]|nr:TylF/MycF family methyltransferase [Rhodospirillales bacterium]
MDDFDFSKRFDYENKFFLSATPDRLSKFLSRYEIYQKIITLPGEIIECGVFKGNSFSQWTKIRGLLEPAHSRKIIGFDTFGAFPEAIFEGDQQAREDFIKAAGSKSIAADDLRHILDVSGSGGNFELVEGNLFDTASTYLQDNSALKIALLIVDVDLYEPTKHVLEMFYPSVVSGGIVLLDDFGAFEGANKAVEEVLGADAKLIRRLPISYSMPFLVKP